MRGRTLVTLAVAGTPKVLAQAVVASDSAAIADLAKQIRGSLTVA